jgi:hypothetical protein
MISANGQRKATATTAMQDIEIFPHSAPGSGAEEISLPRNVKIFAA